MGTYFENYLQQIYISHNTKSYNFASHFQNKIEIAYCFSGMQNVKVGETLYCLKKGDAVFIAPNVVHEYIKCDDADDETESISLMSETDFFASLLPDLVTKSPVSPFVPSHLINTDTAEAFKKMIGVKDNKIELLGWGCIALSGIVASLMFEPLKKKDGLSLAPAIVAYIDSNFQKNLTLKSIAAEFGYSESYIAHIFSDQLKISLRTYLGSVRSEYAKNLILKTNKSLTEIAYECGYNSLNTFCRCFKKRFGVVPSQIKSEKCMA